MMGRTGYERGPDEFLQSIFIFFSASLVFLTQVSREELCREKKYHVIRYNRNILKKEGYELIIARKLREHKEVKKQKILEHDINTHFIRILNDRKLSCIGKCFKFIVLNCVLH